MIWEAWVALGGLYTGGALQISRHLAGHWNYQAWKIKRAKGYGYGNVEFAEFDDNMRGERAVGAILTSFFIMPVAVTLNRSYSKNEGKTGWAIDPPHIRKENERKKLVELEKELDVG